MPAQKAITQPWTPAYPRTAEREVSAIIRGGMAWGLLMVVAAAMLLGYTLTQREVRLTLDGRSLTWRTHQTSVAGLLAEMGLAIGEEDIVLPSLEEELDGGEIVVNRAQPAVVSVDQRNLLLYSHARSVGELLQERGVEVGSQDLILMDGQEAHLDTLLPTVLFGQALDLKPIEIQIRRSITLQVFDDGVPQVLDTLAPTVGQALWEAGNLVFQGDLVQPSLEAPLSTGMRVYIQRATPLTIWADGRRILALTQGKTVEQALAGEFIFLTGKDYTLPAQDTLLAKDLQVQVVRVQEKFVLEEEPISYQTQWQPDAGMELDQWRIIVAGQPGLMRRIIRQVYENGVLKQTVTEREWVETPPTTQVTAYGTQIVLRDLQIADGTVRYWRKIRMLATSYTAATSGKSRDHPAYGITRLGWVATKGVIAVDPRVIRLRTQMYIPGYGFGTAADTGGAILGRRIDLGYDEWNLVLWYKWVDVYLLEPVPPIEQIPFILPTYPQERR